MSNKITEKPTSTTTPTNWFANVGGSVAQFTSSAFSALIGTLIGPQTASVASKATPVDADKLTLSDSVSSDATKHLTWLNLKSTLKDYNDTIYATTTHTHALSDTTGLIGALDGKALISHTHALSSLTQSGATSGQVPEWSGSAWVPATPSGGGASISLPLRAWVETTGNDGTGTVGDPSKPYQTMLAAYNAGARVLYLGAGTHAGITKNGTIDVSIIGHGRGKTVVTTITSTTGAAISIRDLGCKSVSIGTVTQSYPGISAGVNGSSSGECDFHNLLITGNVTLEGQAGHPGSDVFLNGSSAGNSATLTGSNIEILGDLFMRGSAAGSPYDDFSTPADAGNAGNAGTVDIRGEMRVTGSIYLSGSSYASGVNGGMDGSPTSAGTLSVDMLYVGGSVNGEPGDSTFTAAMTLNVRIGARITTMNLDVGMAASGDINGQCIVIPTLNGIYITGSFIYLSHINGVPVGTS